MANADATAAIFRRAFTVQMVPFSSAMERAAEGPLPISSFVPPAPVTDRVACAIRTLSKPDTVSAAENWGDRDAAWPAVAAQLCRTIGSADRATLLATAALALHEIESIARGIRADGAGSAARSPSTLDTTLEFDVASGSIEARRWSRHRECTC